jgi:hypothetical protein
MEHIECSRCQRQQEVNEWDRHWYKGLCKSCVVQNAKVARYREFARNFRDNENAVIDIDFREVFPVGDEPIEGSLVFNVEGFAIAPFRADANGQFTELDSNEWFNWGEQLYFGPKTFNKYEEFKKFRKHCKKNNIQIPDNISEEWDLTRFSKLRAEHEKAIQLMKFTMTFLNDEFGQVDVWIRPWVARFAHEPIWFSDRVEERHIPEAFYGGWTIAEIQRILITAGDGIYHHADNKTAEELETPANILIATNFDKIANYLDQLDPGTFHQVTKPHGYEEEFGFFWT